MAGEDWWRGAVIYQIYPRSFKDTNGDGVGDLKGITEKLDYVKSLGVDGVWLSPVFKSPMRDFGYDVSDYRKVDPLFGTIDDFDALLKRAHELGLKVIIDQVWSHTSSDHPWFQQSREGPGFKLDDWDRRREGPFDPDDPSIRTDLRPTVPRDTWYVWADAKPDGSPPNNWQAWFGGPCWTWDARRRQYYLHNFLPTQPDLNFREPAVQDAILDVARFWLDRGVDGFRLDVANYYVHDARLRDNPPSGDPKPALPRNMQVHQFNSNQPETLDFLARVRALTDSYGAKMMVGELAPGSYDLMAQYTHGKNRLHTAYAFDFLGPLMTAERMAEVLSQWGEGPDDGWPSWAFSNHDVTRVATRWKGFGVENAFALLMCLRGTAFVYQGEELGLTEAELSLGELQDPWGIAGWPATKGRDGCRTPIPWRMSPRGGFTAHESKPWLPIPMDHRQHAVEEQEKKPDSFLASARRLIALRKASPALTRGSFKVISAKDGVLAFERMDGGERMLCVFNMGRAEAKLPAQGKLLWSSGAALDGGVLRVSSTSGALVLLA